MIAGGSMFQTLTVAMENARSCATTMEHVTMLSMKVADVHVAIIVVGVNVVVGVFVVVVAVFVVVVV